MYNDFELPPKRRRVHAAVLDAVGYLLLDVFWPEFRAGKSHQIAARARVEKNNKSIFNKIFSRESLQLFASVSATPPGWRSVFRG